MFRFASLLLALAATTVATSAVFDEPELTYVERQITADDVLGRFKLVFPPNADGICPRFIRHNSTIPNEGRNRIPHSDMTMNGRRCDDNNFMQVYAAAGNAKRASDAVMASSSAFDVESIKELISDISNSGVAVIYGVESKGRECNGADNTLARGTLIALINPLERVQIGSFPYNTGSRYMIVDDPTVAGGCIYTAPLRNATGPSPVPSSSPVVTPETPTSSPVATPSAPSSSKRPRRSKDSKPTPTPSSDPIEVSQSPVETMEASPGVNGVTDSPSPTGDDDDDDGSVCFPAHATVRLEDGSVKTMNQIKLGDRVQVADGVYSDVFMFTHKDATIKHSFVQLSTESGHALTATKGHYIYINGNFAAAMTAKVGDVLQLGNGRETLVNEVATISSVGLFNPQTIHGDIIVDSLRASTFTRTIEPATAQTMLAPLRMLYGAFGWTASFLDNGADQIAAVLPKGQLTL